MGDTKAEKVTFHVVHSVKGGSGKTTFSLLKGIDLAKYNDECTRKVLYLDADFKGTAIKTLLYGKDKSTFSSMHEENHLNKYIAKRAKTGHLKGGFVFDELYVEETLNDYLVETKVTINNILVQGGFLGTKERELVEEELIGELDFIFSSPKGEQKSLFMHDLEGMENPGLALGLYTKRMRKLLKEVIASGYTDIVIDMLPGEDDYSHELLKLLNELNKKDNISIFFYAITTNDLTHIDAEFEELACKLRKKSKWLPYEKYIVVFNKLRENEFSGGIDRHCKKLKMELQEKKCTYLERVYSTMCEYQKSYYEFCREWEQKDFGYSLGSEMVQLIREDEL